MRAAPQLVVLERDEHRQPAPHPEIITYDLCILGAGIAGLNALFAASRHLSRDQKVVLVDRGAGPGGMWNCTYDYVRLHQPHPMFTAGNTAWTSGEHPSHLATRPEVVAHLAHCLESSRKQLTLIERFRYEYRSHDEGGPRSDDVTVECVSVSPGRPPLRIRAKKVIKAFGFDVASKAPLALSSAQVHSISPDRHHVLGAEMRDSDAPVYIIGGGKTGMDTAYALLRHFPRKHVNLVIGSGTMFNCRDKLFPTGVRRIVGGYTPVEMFLDLAQRFDGTNEHEVLDRLRAKYTVALTPNARRFMLGLLSERENAVIAAGAREIIQDYFCDVVDRGGRPTLLLKSGESRPIEPGSWFINCTSYLFKENVPYEPFVSRSGKVVSIQPTSSIHPLSSCAAYLATHLAYLNKLQQLPLYELDNASLYTANRDAFSATIAPHTLYNTALMLAHAPRSVGEEFGTDNSRWYPMPRRILNGILLLRHQKRNPDHFRRTLDTIRDRFGIRCGLLQQPTPAHEHGHAMASGLA